MKTQNNPQGQFTFNRFNQQVGYDPTYSVPQDGPADQSVVPLFYDENQIDSAKGKGLRERIEQTEQTRLARIERHLSQRTSRSSAAAAATPRPPETKSVSIGPAQSSIEPVGRNCKPLELRTG